jgi:hypothetical protein
MKKPTKSRDIQKKSLAASQAAALPPAQATPGISPAPSAAAPAAEHATTELDSARSKS